jgi:hypothetical protein
MPIFKSFASLWTLTDHPVPESPWSLDEKVCRIRDAGFDGVGGHALPEIGEAARSHGIEFIAYVVLDGENYVDELEAVAKLNPARVNAFFGTHDTPPESAARELVRVFDKAAELGVALDLETHRATCTETPEKIRTLSNDYRKLTGKSLRYSYDFSHPAVVKHLFPHEFSPRLSPETGGLREVRQMHFRPFNGHHCQIPATDGRGRLTKTCGDWLEFTTRVIERWGNEVEEDAILWWCPELGPVSSGYALEGFPDVWEDAKFIHREIFNSIGRLALAAG